MKFQWVTRGPEQRSGAAPLPPAPPPPPRPPRRPRAPPAAPRPRRSAPRWLPGCRAACGGCCCAFPSGCSWAARSPPCSGVSAAWQLLGPEGTGAGGEGQAGGGGHGCWESFEAGNISGGGERVCRWPCGRVSGEERTENLGVSRPKLRSVRGGKRREKGADLAGNQQGLLGPEEPGEGIWGAACGVRGADAAAPASGAACPVCRGRAGPGNPRPPRSALRPRPRRSARDPCPCTARPHGWNVPRVALRARACAWAQSPLQRGSALGYLNLGFVWVCAKSGV